MANPVPASIISDLRKGEKELDAFLGETSPPSASDNSKVTISRKPPPETPEQALIRTHVVISFWAVVIILALPLWWVTTSIYRAPLPLKEMSDWAQGRTCKAEFPLLVDVVVVGAGIGEESSSEGRGGDDGKLGEVEGLLRNVQLALDDAREGFKASHLRLRLVGDKEGSIPDPAAESCLNRSEDEGDDDGDDNDNGSGTSPETIAALLRLIPGQPGSTTHGHMLYPSSRAIDLFYASTYNPASSASSAALAKYIAKTLQDVFAEEEQMITYLLEKAAKANAASMGLTASGGGELSNSNGDGNGNGNASGAGGGGSSGHGEAISQVPDISRKMARIIRYSPTYHLTFSLFTASGLPSSWDIAPAISTYLSPLLDAISPISNFTVDSQVQFYASFSPTVQPAYDEEAKAWALKKDDLSNFINSAEWPLTSIKNYPTINFIIYIPGEEHTPLTVPESVVNNVQTNAWLLPQWGGIIILNPPQINSNTNTNTNSSTVTRTPPQRLTTLDLKPALDIFAAQLLALLGTPSSSSSASPSRSSTTLSLPIRLDSLTRQRSAEVLLSASSTLGSLARLVHALPNISIPPSVSVSVQKTLLALEKSCEELKQGRFLNALKAGRYAEAEAEKAFFERTMVAQVYFPEEHKVAVYLPLLGPVGVPLIMGLARVAKEWIMAMKQRVRGAS